MRPNKKARSEPLDLLSTTSVAGTSVSDTMMEEDIERYANALPSPPHAEDADPDLRDDDNDDDEADDEAEDEELKYFPSVPVVMPRKKFSGACNVETVKDGAQAVCAYSRRC